MSKKWQIFVIGIKKILVIFSHLKVLVAVDKHNFMTEKIYFFNLTG